MFMKIVVLLFRHKTNKRNISVGQVVRTRTYQTSSNMPTGPGKAETIRIPAAGLFNEVGRGTVLQLEQLGQSIHHTGVSVSRTLTASQKQRVLFCS